MSRFSLEESQRAEFSRKSGEKSADSQNVRGFTLMELLLAMAVFALVVSVAIPGLSQYIDRSNEANAISDMGRIVLELQRFRLANGDQLPDSLDQVNWTELDPWGNPYEYLRIAGANPNPGQLRKDQNLVPVNTDFDLYSLGKDGESVPPFTSGKSRDDIVRAANGAFFGRAEDY